MPVNAIALLEAGEDTTLYTSPSSSIDPVVKLIVTSAAGKTHGTGFVLPGQLFDFVIITARHVLRPFGNTPSMVEIVTSTGETVLACAIGWQTGTSDSTDLGVALVLDPLNLASALTTGSASSGSAVLEGYPANSTTKSVKALDTLKVFATTLKHTPVAPSLAGTSGGPLFQDGSIVGMHIRADVGIPVSMTTVNSCADEATASVQAVL